jgi:uncharacterized membrane protein YfcA
LRFPPSCFRAYRKAGLDLFGARNLATSIALVPLGIAGTYLGVWMHKRITPVLFFRVVCTLFFLTGAKILYDRLSGLASG